MNVSRLDDFLALSLAHPDGFPAFSESLASGGYLEVWDTGVLCIEPAPHTDTATGSSQKDIVLSCGIHGNETAPIELCQRLLSGIISGQVQCQHRVLLIFGNLDAINLAVRQVEDNLNRLFCGEHGLTEIANSNLGKPSEHAPQSNKERVRAAKLERYLARFYQARHTAQRWHLDLHTAIRPSQYEQFAVYPYTHDERYSRELLALLSSANINTLLLSDAPSPTFSYYSAVEFGALSLTVELGKVMPFGENDPQRLAQLEQTLTNLLSSPHWQAPTLNLTSLNVFQVCQEITKNSTQFCFHFNDDVVNFQQFAPGSLLAEDGSQQWQVGEQAEAVIFPNAKVAIGHRAALMVVSTVLTDSMLSE